MAESIYFVQDDDSLVEMSEKQYDSEAILQELIAKYPNILSGEQMNPASPRRWLLVKREMRIPGDTGEAAGRWSVDHLFLDQDGIPTLVEVKRSTDTRIRREVVGQMLDYAANAVMYWPIERIRSQFEEHCAKEGEDAADIIAGHLDSEDDADVDKFWASVNTNLKAENIRMVFVADVIPNELRRIVEFLNGQMGQAEVLAVELKQFAGGGFQTLVPRVLGQTAEAQRKKNATSSYSSQPLTKNQFLDVARTSCSKQVAEAISRLIQWAMEQKLNCDFDEKKSTSTFFASFHTKSMGSFYPFSLRTSNSRMVLQPKHIQRFKPFDDPEIINDLKERFESVPGFRIRGGMNGRPCIELEEVAVDSNGFDKMISVLEWVFDQVKNHDV